MFQFLTATGPIEKKGVEIFEARLKRRQLQSDPSVKIVVKQDPHCAAEEFRLSGGKDAENLELSYDAPAAFIYAVGKILRSGRFEKGIFTPGEWRGVNRPEKPFRNVYFASHFCNVYEMWPLEKMEEYIEDMALLGYNYLHLTKGTLAKIPGTPETENDFKRRLHLFRYANSLGMKIAGSVHNIGFADTPAEWRAKASGHSFFGTELCVSNAEALEYLARIRHEEFEAMRDIDMGVIIFWPYDQGGCGCPDCFPYGANGMFKLAARLLPEIKAVWPDCKIAWSCWEFGREGTNEWEKLYEKINSGEADFIDYLEIDSHGSFPEYPLVHGLPGKVKMFTFPEISMFGRCPWGGFGAPPLPKRFSSLFGEIAHLSAGGRLYSEGIFEDFNKAIYAAMFNSGTNSVETAIAEYARWELGVDGALKKDFDRLVELLEENHEGLIWLERQEGSNEEFFTLKNKPVWSLKGKVWNNMEELISLARKIDRELPDWARTGWRWRLFMIRAEIDYQLYKDEGQPDGKTEEMMNELVKIYGITPALASRRVCPFTDEWLKKHDEEGYKLNMKSLGVD